MSFLLNVVDVISAVAGQSPDLRDRPHDDSDDSDELIGSYTLVDVLEEEGELVVLIEIPGFYSEDVSFKVRQDILILMDSRDREFHEILLPAGYNLGEARSVGFNNGVITIKYEKAAKSPLLLAD